jgi:hypothetical protein
MHNGFHDHLVSNLFSLSNVDFVLYYPTDKRDVSSDEEGGRG